jgi:predicted dehydrogenase
LGAGVRAIICEKPLALTLPEAEAIIAACAAADTPLIVNFTRRFDLAAQQAAAWLAEQGPVQAAQGVYVRGIANNGAHLLDLLHWWAGDIQEVVYQRARWPDSPDVVLRLAGGGLAMLNAVSGYDLFRLDVFAAQGVLRLDDGGLKITLRAADAPTPSGITSLLPPQRLPSGLDHALMNLYDHAAEVLAGNAAPLCGPLDGLAVTRTLAMIEAAG